MQMLVVRKLKQQSVPTMRLLEWRVYTPTSSFPDKERELLMAMGHDVLTVQAAGNANLGIPDETVLAFAISDNRAVLTLNRQNFIRLHRANSEHAGIVVCTNEERSRSNGNSY
jgi:Domain of unknown function (DUF5615)